MFSFLKNLFRSYKKNKFDKVENHILKQMLNFEYEFFEDSLVIYKEFTSKNLLNFYKYLNTTDKYTVAEYIKDYVYRLKIHPDDNENKVLQALLGVCLQQNLDKKHNELLNDKIDDEFDVDIKYFAEAKHKLKGLIKDFTKNKVKVAKELGIV